VGNDRPLFAGTQWRQRADAGRHAADGGRGPSDRDDVADDTDARTTLYSPTVEDSRLGSLVAVTRDEVKHLIDLIVAELLAAQGARSVGRCACHSVLDDCCPDRLRGVLDAGATRVGLHATGGAPAGVASLIDHPLLKPDAKRSDIEELCREAIQFKFATVCINPTWVSLASRLLAGSGVGVCSVVGFPLGATTADVKGYETQRAIFDGAREIDMVINVGALKAGALRTVGRDIEAVAAPCRECGVLSKVIIEAALLTDDE